MQRRTSLSVPILSKVGLALVLLFSSSDPLFSQGGVAPLTVSEDVALQMIASWASSLQQNDLEALSTYYADPQMVTPWRQRLAVRRVLTATPVSLHSVTPASGRSWGGTPLSGEARFTLEFHIEGHPEPILETRVWGITNRNGYLQIATEMQESRAAIAPGQRPANPFPQFGSDPAPQQMLIPPPPSMMADAGSGTAIPETRVTAPISSDPSRAGYRFSETPIARDKLIHELWNGLLLKFQMAHRLRNERMFIQCFAKQPVETLAAFRQLIAGKSWLQMPVLEIDDDSVAGNNLNATFRFRYSLWGPAVNKDQIIEVDCAAVRTGNGWKFARYGAELIVEPRKTGGINFRGSEPGRIMPFTPRNQRQRRGLFGGVLGSRR